MPSTHLSLHYHLVFSTKNRLPMITKDWRVNLHAYLGGIVNGIKGVPLAIGGIEDHASSCRSAGNSSIGRRSS
ncbi:MAG: transposase [Acidobacteria bacterium]|nr:transposase [Acidobacteriota bacterium]